MSRRRRDCNGGGAFSYGLCSIWFMLFSYWFHCALKGDCGRASDDKRFSQYLPWITWKERPRHRKLDASFWGSVIVYGCFIFVIYWKYMLFKSFLLVGSVIGGFYWLFLWNFKEIKHQPFSMAQPYFLHFKQWNTVSQPWGLPTKRLGGIPYSHPLVWICQSYPPARDKTLLLNAKGGTFPPQEKRMGGIR